MEPKDAIIAAAILDSTSRLTDAAAAADTRRIRLEADTETLRMQTEVDIQRSATRRQETLNAQNREFLNRQEIASLSRKNRTLSDRMAEIEAEMNEMRSTMKEWVSSQRGLLALAKELKKEIDSCPNKEHHVLADSQIGTKIAKDAAEIAHQNIEVEGIPKEIPCFSPSWGKAPK